MDLNSMVNMACAGLAGGLAGWLWRRHDDFRGMVALMLFQVVALTYILVFMR